MSSTTSHDKGSAARVPLTGLRALVVEDSWLIAEALRSILDSTGLDVAEPATTLADAERLSDASDLDVAVVDLDLRGKMSYELIERLSDRGVSVIVVSGYELPASLVGKVTAVMAKPIRAADLLAVVRRIGAARAAA